MKINRALLPLLILIVLSSLVFSPRNKASANSQSHPNIKYSSTNSSPKPNKYYLPLVGNMAFGVFYVSPNGNDNNPGTLALPFRTINKGASVLHPGNRLYVRGGVYQEAVDIVNSGTSSSNIFVLAFPGETPIIDGNNYHIPNETGGALLEISGSYVTVSGFEVKYSSYLGVLVEGTFVIATNLNTHHSWHSGMRIAGDYSVIQYSQVWSNDMQNANGIYPAGDSTALTASRHPNGAKILNNVVHGNWGIGLSTYEASGTVIEGNIVYDNYNTNIYLSDVNNVLFQNNFIYATGSVVGGTQVGIQVADEKYGTNGSVYPAYSSDITIINNIVYHTRQNLACFHGSSGTMNNVLIANNTFVNSTYEDGIEFKYNLTYNNVRFMNNLIQQDGELPIILLPNSHPGLTLSYNLWSKEPDHSAMGEGDFIGNPFLSQSGSPYTPEWFTLNSDSPAIDSAYDLPQITDDYFSNTRENPYDKGAIEFFPAP